MTSTIVRLVMLALMFVAFGLMSAPLNAQTDPDTAEEPPKFEAPVKSPDPTTEQNTEPVTEENAASADEIAPTENIDDIVPPEIIRDLSVLPFPARRMHELILEAAISGDIEKLRPFIGYGDDITMLSLGGIEEDPIAFLKSLSGDPKGHEVMAILAEILESGFVRMDPGTDHELFLWPYFFTYPLDKLTPEQRVELFRIVTYGDYEDMKSFGAYIFYRVGITPKGRWRFFVAGD